MVTTKSHTHQFDLSVYLLLKVNIESNHLCVLLCRSCGIMARVLWIWRIVRVGTQMQREYPNMLRSLQVCILGFHSP